MSITMPTTSADLTSNEQDAILQAARITDYDARWPRLMDLARQSKAQFSAAVAQREEFARELDAVKAARGVLAEEVQMVRNARITAQRDHEEFRVKVRDVAIRVARQQDWCDEGLNDVLEELGLPRKTQAYDVEVDVEFTLRKTITVRVDEATDGDSAREQVDSTLVEDTLSNECEWPDGDDVNLDGWTVQSVDVAD